MDKRLKELKAKQLMTLDETIEFIMLLNDLELEDAIKILDQYIEEVGFEKLN